MAREKKVTISEITTKEYAKTLADLKDQIKNAQIKAVVSASREMLALYWSIGKTIADRRSKDGWGTSIVEHLAKDLQNNFPGIQGFSIRNVFRMQAFYVAYEKLPQPVAEIKNLPIFRIPWGHNILLIERVKNVESRLWYAEKTIQEGWSRTALEKQIKLGLHEREGKAITNFSLTLPAAQSNLAKQTLKDPYVFDFLSLSDDYNEREVEEGLISHIQKFLLELGKGFAFVGRQKHLVVGNNDYYIDLLFYHVKLRCYVVVELKTGPFKPEYAGKLNFYLSAVDELLRHPDDKPTVGLLLCKTRERIIAEYALKDINKPMGVARYETELVESLPKNLKGSLPTIEELEAELEKQETLKQKRETKKD